MTPFALLLQLCGLSHREGGDFLDVRPDTVKSWSAGRNRVPAGVIEQLRDLARALDRTAERAVETILAETPETADIEIGYPTDDYEARALGLPCVGAWSAMAARVIAAIDRPVRLVPRGSTPATAAAIEARESCP